MEKIAEDLIQILLKSGSEFVHIQSSLWTLGLAREQMQEFCERVISGLVCEGITLSCLTSTADYGRKGTPFRLNETPSDAGFFSEYLRKMEGSVRSLHPISSVTSIGSRSSDLSGCSHWSGFSYTSPFGKLHRENAMLVVLGGAFKGSFTFAHYVESACGVPYKYNKVYRHPVYDGEDELVDRDFFLSVPYRGFNINYTCEQTEEAFFARGILKKISVGRSFIYLVRARDAFDVLCMELETNTHFLLKENPLYIYGEIPFDGVVE